MQQNRASGAGRGWAAMGMAAATVVLTMILVACGGSGGGGAPATPSAAAAAPLIGTQPQSVRIADGQPAAFAVAVASATAPSYQWFRGGAAIPGANAATYTLATAQLSDDGASFSVVVTNGAGAVQSASAVLGVSPVAPAFVADAPTTVSAITGEPATFAVAVTGSAPLTFQWRRGGGAIPGATSTSYTLPATDAADNGATYDVVVSNAAGTATSAVFTLVVATVAQAPAIASQPAALRVTAGTAASFSVVASGTAPFAYQWLRDGVPIPGAQAATYVLDTTTVADSGAQFSVVVSNTAGSVTSAGALLTVTPAVSIALVAGNIGGQGTIDGTGTTARFDAPTAVATDSAGNTYVGDGSAVRKLAPGGVVTTFAGSPTASGSVDGAGGAARFGAVTGLAVDATGTIYASDGANHTIRKITSSGVVTTLAGTSGTAGSNDAVGTAARFNGPAGIVADGAGNLFVADSGNQTIRRIAADGSVTTFAGSAGVTGSADGTGPAATFNLPTGLAIDAASVLYVSDFGNATVRRISPAAAVTTVAGSAGQRGSADGTGAAARFDSPYGIAVDGAGTVYVGDAFSRTVRRISSAGVVSTFAGAVGQAGSADGTGSAASFAFVAAIASGSAGNLTLADRDNFTIRTLTSTGVVTTIAGASPMVGGADGAGSAATFTQPYGVAVDASGILYVSDPGNGTIRRVTTAGVVSTLAGTAGTTGPTDGTGPAARFGSPRGIAVTGAGTVFVADAINNTIRVITPGGTVTTLAGDALIGGSADGTGAAASFNLPTAVAVDGAGNAFVADSGNSTIRKVTPAGVVTTFAGTAGVFGATDGTGPAASFNFPTAIAIDAAGNLYVGDRGNSLVRKITSAGVVTTIAGVPGVSGANDGAATAATFGTINGIAVDRAGTVYVADTGNRTIRKIDATGTVSTLVGAADGRIGVRLGALPGALSRPLHVAVDAAGVLYITDASGVVSVGR